jgi:hypothetical protein
VGAVLLLATLRPAALAEETEGNSLRRISAEPAAWTGPALTAQLVPPAGRDSVVPNATSPTPASPPVAPSPAEIITPSTTPKQYESPLLDGKLPTEELIPPVVTEGSTEEPAHRGVQPYGGGHPTDWSWGCGGSPYRQGPGLCDNYKVGPRWHVTVDGIVLTREHTNLDLLTDAMPGSIPGPFFPTLPQGNGILTNSVPALEQFSHGPGGRITFTSQIARCTGYDVQAVYEGVNDWNASIVYPVQEFHVPFYTPVITSTTTTTTNTNTGGGTPPSVTTTTTQTTTGPFSPTTAPLPFAEEFQQRSLHYYSSLNSGELNFLREFDDEWRPFCGVRYISFNDEINDSLNQSVQPPLPFAGANATNGQFVGISETDRLNLFHVQNNLMGFQIGMYHDTVKLNDRFALEGFVNGGVYYNQVKYSNVVVVRTTQFLADDTTTTGFNEQRTDNSTVVNNDARDLSEISYEAEASLTGVCRLNKCWALRAGYQVLWINHLRTAQNAYLGDAFSDTDLLFHGWHAGIECRR